MYIAVVFILFMFVSHFKHAVLKEINVLEDS